MGRKSHLKHIDPPTIQAEYDKWTKLLREISGNSKIEVYKIVDGKLHIKYHEGSCSSIMRKSSELISAVKHVVQDYISPPQHYTLFGVTDTTGYYNSLMQNVTSNNKWLGYGASDMLHRLFSPSLLESSHIDFDSMTDNTQSGAATVRFTYSNKYELRLIKDAVALLRSSLSPDTLFKVLSGEAPPLQATNNDISDLAQQAFYFTTRADGTGEITFNYRVLQQRIQEVTDMVHQIPIVAHASEDNTCIIDKNVLIKYLSYHLNGMALIPSSDGKLTPMMFSPESTHLGATELEIVLDISGSMKVGFEKYISGVRSFIEVLCAECKNTKITITPFSNTTQSQTFASSDDQLHQIEQFLGTLSADGATRLHCSMKEAFLRYDDGHPRTIIVCTDGANTDPTCSAEDVAQAAIDARNHNVAVYTIGSGPDYNTTFFEYIAQHTGCKHFHIDNTAALEELQQQISAVCTNRELWEFIQRQTSQYVIANAGELTSGPEISGSDKTTVIRHSPDGASTSFHIGTSGPSTCPSVSPDEVNYCTAALFSFGCATLAQILPHCMGLLGIQGDDCS